MLGTAVGMAVAYVIIDYLERQRLDLGMIGNSSVFLIFHTLIILPLALGMAVGKKEVTA
jgi:hypothetical protein